MERSLEDLKKLAQPEFTRIINEDPVIIRLKLEADKSQNAFSGVLDALCLQSESLIGNLPVLPLTAARWAFLWALGNRFTGAASDDDSPAARLLDADILLYVLSHDLRKLDMPAVSIAGAASGYSSATGLEMEQLLHEIADVIEKAFLPLSMLPSAVENDGDIRYDGAWLSRIGTIGSRESNLPYTSVIHDLPLSLVCNFYVCWRLRTGADASKIHYRGNDEILELIIQRIDELADQYLQDN